jgi:hypothetical protein
MTTRELTGAGIIRALGGVRPAVTRAVAARGDALAAAIAARAPGAKTTVAPRGAGEVVVTASAPGLFAREFGSRDRAPDPVIGAAIDEMSGR